MKLWLDDIRPAPEGWVWLKTPAEVILMMQYQDKNDRITDVSLDNDLGELIPEGHTVVYWMAENNVWPTNRPTIHSANPVRKEFMDAMIDRYGPY